MMATELNKPSVIAKLMGLDEVPSKQQRVYRNERVFSENYLQKSASIVSRQKRSNKARQKSRKILKKANATINDSSNDVSLKYIEQKGHSFDGKQCLKSTIVDPQNSGQNGKLGKRIGNVKHGSKSSFLVDSDTTFAWEFKKQLLERSKRTKVRHEIWSSRRVFNLVEEPSLPDLESKQRSKLVTQVVICKNDGWKDKSVTKLPILKRFNFSSSPYSKLKKMSKGDFSSTPGRHKNNNNLSTNSEDEFSCGNDAIKHISAQIACNDSAKEGCFSCSLDVSFEKDLPHEDGFTPFNCVDIDDELPRSMGEAYQPSPNSVLEPDNSSSSEYGDTVSTDLHGLWMKLQILKSESEENQSKPDMLTLSDRDATERSSLCVGQNTKPFRSSGPKGSRELSYLMDVLNESGFFGGKMEVNFVRSECMMNTLLFETLEKKYGKQESWNKADRQLLFDRINSGLSEIFRSQLDFVNCSKPLRRKMSTVLRRDIVEEELWNLLLGQEREVNANLSEKAVGKEPWLELVDEVDSIVGEIEAFLFDKLATELVAV